MRVSLVKNRSICPFMKVQVDCPSNHSDGFLPILDLKTRIVKNQVEYRFMKNMGYNGNFRAKVIQAALTGYRRQCALADTGARPLHRPREFDETKRRNKKLMSKDGAWHRPQYHLAAFYPATPDGWLTKGINKIMKEEGERIGLRIKVVEESGTSLGSLGSLLTRPDLSGCLFPDHLCRSMLRHLS